MRDDRIHPELRRIARVLPRRAGRPSLARLSRLATPYLASGRRARGLDVEEVGEVTVRVHRPRGGDGPHPALLWIHGGGFVLGHPASEDRACRAMAEALGAVVCAVDYRLAPEHPFPVPLHDCHDALVWLAGRDDVDAGRVAVGGASAGGGLAAGLVLLARERAAVAPVFQLLIYPMLDDRTVLRDDVDERGFRLWDNTSNRYGWASYLGGPPGSPDVSALAAPARHDDLSGLPPAWIGVGTQDLFHDEDVAYAARLGDADVPCELVVVDGAFHAFDMLAPRAGVARDFRTSYLDALAAALRPTPPRPAPR